MTHPDFSKMSPDNKFLIELDSTESTNNYAMALAEQGTVEHGMTITAKTQTRGKGQRGNNWLDEPGANLLMSIIVVPARPTNGQFAFNCSVATAVINALTESGCTGRLSIKWPNDIMVGDKKAGGILIENVLRGSVWNYAIVGIGLNINQSSMPVQLPHATSLRIESGLAFDLNQVRDSIVRHILTETQVLVPVSLAMDRYNERLYKKNKIQLFRSGGDLIETRILQCNYDGTLRVELIDGSLRDIRHGEMVWEYGC